jgi:hypothetical protein
MLVVALDRSGGEAVLFTHGGRGGAGDQETVDVFDLIMTTDLTHVFLLTKKISGFPLKEIKVVVARLKKEIIVLLSKRTYSISGGKWTEQVGRMSHKGRPGTEDGQGRFCRWPW